MEPRPFTRKKRHVSKVMAMVSLGFHSIIVLALTYFAAREGLLGKQLKKIAVEMVKEKPPEKPKEEEKPKEIEKPVEEKPKPEEPKLAAAPKVEPPKSADNNAAAAIAPAAAPPAIQLPSFFSDGAKVVESVSDPIALYKNSVENTFLSRWQRPPGVQDQYFNAEVEISIDSAGEVKGHKFKRTSGNPKWDESVRKAVTATQRMNRPPPTNFPSQVTLRFDVQEQMERINP